jgi:hypothetical protein
MDSQPHESPGALPLVFGLGTCVVSRGIVSERRPIARCHRQKPDNTMDSGWRFFADNRGESGPFEVCDLTTLSVIEPKIVPLLSAPVQAAFVRDAVTGEFVRAHSD